MEKDPFWWTTGDFERKINTLLGHVGNPSKAKEIVRELIQEVGAPNHQSEADFRTRLETLRQVTESGNSTDVVNMTYSVQSHIKADEILREKYDEQKKGVADPKVLQKDIWEELAGSPSRDKLLKKANLFEKRARS